MIKIKEFREFVADIRGKVNADMENAIAGTIVAVKEEHLIKKLKDKDKLWLCSNFPDADDIVENRDSYNTNMSYFSCWKKYLPDNRMTKKKLNFTNVSRK